MFYPTTVEAVLFAGGKKSQNNLTPEVLRQLDRNNMLTGQIDLSQSAQDDSLSYEEDMSSDNYESDSEEENYDLANENAYELVPPDPFQNPLDIEFDDEPYNDEDDINIEVKWEFKDLTGGNEEKLVPPVNRYKKKAP